MKWNITIIILSKKELILAKLNRAQIIEIEIIVWNRKVTLYLMTIILTTLERWSFILLDRLIFRRSFCFDNKWWIILCIFNYNHCENQSIVVLWQFHFSGYDFKKQLYSLTQKQNAICDCAIGQWRIVSSSKIDANENGSRSSKTLK